MPSEIEDRASELVTKAKRLQADLDDVQTALDGLLEDIETLYESAYLAAHLRLGGPCDVAGSKRT